MEPDASIRIQQSDAVIVPINRIVGNASVIYPNLPFLPVLKGCIPSVACTTLFNGRKLAIVPAPRKVSEFRAKLTGVLQKLREISPDRVWFVSPPYPGGTVECEECNLVFFSWLAAFSLRELWVLVAPEDFNYGRSLVDGRKGENIVAYLAIADDGHPPMADVLPEVLPAPLPIPASLPIPAPQHGELLPSQASISNRMHRPEVHANRPRSPSPPPDHGTAECVICLQECASSFVTLCCVQVICAVCFSQLGTTCPTCRKSPLEAIEAVLNADMLSEYNREEVIGCACGAVFKRKQENRHRASCPERPISCEACHIALPLSRMRYHLTDLHRGDILKAYVRGWLSLL